MSEEKSLAKEDITVQVRRSGTETSPGGGLDHHQAKKNFTTFAALNKKVVEQSGAHTPETSTRSSSSSLILQPAVEEQDKQFEDINLENKPIEVGESFVDEIKSVDNKLISNSSEQEQEKSITTPKFVDDPVTNELKEFVKQRYARRYRSKFSNPRHHHRNKSSNNLIDEVILEEDEDALIAENLEVISEEPSNPVKSILKRNSISTDSDSNNSDENYSNSSSCYSNKSDLSSSAESGIELSSDSNTSEAETEVNKQLTGSDNNKMMMLKRHQQKRKKGVTFSTPEPVKTSAQ